MFKNTSIMKELKTEI